MLIRLLSVRTSLIIEEGNKTVFFYLIGACDSILED